MSRATPTPDCELFVQLPLNQDKFRPDLDGCLAEFLIKACAPYRGDRFATAVEMRRALEEVRAAM